MLPHFVTLLSQREITSPSVFIICYADLFKKKKNLHSKSSSQVSIQTLLQCVVIASFLRGKV